MYYLNRPEVNLGFNYRNNLNHLLDVICANSKICIRIRI